MQIRKWSVGNYVLPIDAKLREADFIPTFSQSFWTLLQLWRAMSCIDRAAHSYRHDLQPVDVTQLLHLTQGMHLFDGDEQPAIVRQSNICRRSRDPVAVRTLYSRQSSCSVQWTTVVGPAAAILLHSNTIFRVLSYNVDVYVVLGSNY